MSAEPRIAIVGIGGLFPGSRTLGQYWHNIVNAVDCSRPVPPGRWLLDPADAIADGTAIEDHVPHSRAYYLDEIPQQTTDLAIDAAWLARMDPVFHLILRAGVQAFRDAKTASIDRSRVGVILGHIALPSEKSSALAVEILGQSFLEKLGIGADLPRVERLNRFVAGLPAGVLASARPGRRHVHARCGLRLVALRVEAGGERIASGPRRPDVDRRRCRAPIACTRRWVSPSCGRFRQAANARHSMRPGTA